MTALGRAGRTVGKQALRRLTSLLLHVVHYSLVHLGYRWTRRLLVATSPDPPAHRCALDRARQVGITVNFSARRGGWDKSCLRRSLVAWWLLRWLRIPTELRFGLSLQEGGSIAHAWLEHHGEPVNDGPNVASLFPFSHGGDLAAEFGVST